MIRCKGGEIRDTKTLNLSRNIVSLQVLVDVSFFHLVWSTWPATKTFVAGWRNAARWLVDLLEHEQICCATSCEFEEKRATKSKFVAQSKLLSTFRNNFLQPATNVFVGRQIDHARWKTGNIDENLLRNNVARQFEGFCISYFAALRQQCSCTA